MSPAILNPEIRMGTLNPKTLESGEQGELRQNQNGGSIALSGSMESQMAN